ncbi:hypothetical protein MKW98_028680 [Papaver atlanticum]|uniref:Peroxidase n=1 Tax=Papaver atlanticum TaxID=357466 RepID=A0AAD4S3B7_9MAGN|nr:hypothetical protein MKW98_028680 [Papaver atlanticum]
MSSSYSFLVLLLVLSAVVLASADYKPANYNDVNDDDNQVPSSQEYKQNKPQSGNPTDENEDDEDEGGLINVGIDHRPWTSMLSEPSLQSYLSNEYYQKSCPNLEEIIHNKVAAWIKKDATIAASILRLHFHDCAIRGCDASILLSHPGSERDAEASKTLRGFELIDDIKAEVEKKCPKTVSCADILTAAARDATVAIGVPFWEVPYGRKDGLVSIAKEADYAVPKGRESITTLIEFFQSIGLNLIDLVVLSGAHTIGKCNCGVIQDRLYNYQGTGKADPTIDVKYLNFLKRKCKRASEYVELDGETPTTFDSMYYTNLQMNKGLLKTDQLLNSDSRTSGLVDAMANQPEWLFLQQFSVSMVKLGNTQVLTGRKEGEIRTKCSSINSANY